FLIHPARFEAAGIVPAEAAAFGVPTITNNVGGLATTVADRVSGVVLPKHSPAESYVRVLKEYCDNPVAYHLLCETTRQRYETELNWDVVSKKLYRICLDACSLKS
ncbi:MAG: glycosyltransferase, partial [Chloroflexi bacterium]|nr:glycosyltransferase [Chloroflexota bacterium]